MWSHSYFTLGTLRIQRVTDIESIGFLPGKIQSYAIALGRRTTRVVKHQNITEKTQVKAPE